MTIKPVSGEIQAQPLNDNFSYLDSKVESVNGGPGGYFKTEVELKVAYPNGSDRFFVVSGYTYWWKNSQWIKGDVFVPQGIANGQVTRVKTDFLQPLFKNIIGELERGFYYTYDNGNRTQDATMATSAIVNVSVGQKYKVKDTGIGTSKNQAHVYFWKSNFSGLSGILADGEFVVPTGAAMMRIGVKSTAIDDVILCVGTEDFKFADPDHKIIKSDQIADNIIKREATAYLKKDTINLFNVSSFVSDYYYYLDGKVSQNQPFGTTELIKCKSGDKLTMSWVGFSEDGRTWVTFWKSDGTFVSGMQTKDFTVPDDSAIDYFRVAINRDNADKTIIEKVDKTVWSDQEIIINKRQIADFTDPYCYMSICGDSISTFSGVMIPGNRPFYPNNNVTSVTDTYWGKLLNNKFSLKLLVNNSWSGSWLSTGQGNGAPLASGTMACKNLSVNGIEPDIVVLYKGTNDFSGNVPLDNFEKEYRLFINNCKEKYSSAKIYACTLLYRSSGTTNGNGHVVEDFNNIIKAVSSDLSVDIIDFYNCGIDTENSGDYLIDGLHPNKDGHDLMYKKAKEIIYDYV